MAQAQKYLPALALAEQITMLLACFQTQAVHLQARQRQAILTIGITRSKNETYI